MLKKWKRIVVLGLVLCGTSAGLAAGEVILRLVGSRLWERLVSADLSYPWIGYHPILGWVNRPGTWAPGPDINSLGFRSRETSLRKPDGSLRIVCLGDSRTFGLWTDQGGAFRYDNDYPAALEQLLHEQGAHPAVEVINAGVIGYTSAQGLAQLQTQLLPLHPDVITVSFGFNDHSLAWNAALGAREPRNRFARELFYLASRSYWFRLGKAAYDALPSLHATPFSERWVDLDAYWYNLHRIAEVGSQHGIHVLFVSQALRPIEMGESAQPFPGAPPDKTGLYHLLGVKDLGELHQLDRSYREVLSQVAEEEGVPLANASLAFTERQELLFGPYDLVHCNTAGAQVIAETIRQKLVELGWLLPPEDLRRASASTPPTKR